MARRLDYPGKPSVIPKLLKYAAGRQQKKKGKRLLQHKKEKEEKDRTSCFQLGRWKGPENAGNL